MGQGTNPSTMPFTQLLYAAAACPAHHNATPPTLDSMESRLENSVSSLRLSTMKRLRAASSLSLR